MDAVEPADRSLLLDVAYRMLGSAAEAEDAVQDAYARWYALPGDRRAEVRSPTAWLVTTVSRICLDILGSARARRERYVGEWLPEPVPGSTGWTTQGAPAPGDPADAVSLDESLHMALLVVLETMTPAERVAFVLHDVFGYPFGEIAGILGRTPQACRQLASSARRRVRAQGRHRVPPDDQARAVAAFKAAWRTGDVAQLVRQLAPDVVAVTDGGGRVSAALAPVRGAAEVAAFLVDAHRRQPGLTIDDAVVNAHPGLVARDPSGSVVAVVSLVAGEGGIDRVWVVRNPAKLARWNRPGRAAG
ncbi:MAG TPA: RNA polymerase sigma factor SigJ [Acidimicrobiales bacterium]